MERPYYYVYEITNNINGKYYRGVHSTEDLNDGYMGSGDAIKAAIEKYGIENFTKTILEFFDTAEEAYAREAELVTIEEVNSPMCYNLKKGGQGGCEKKFTDEELKEHRKEYTAEWRNNNPEYQNNYAKENRDKRRSYENNWRNNNPEKYKEIQHKQHRKWYKENIERKLEYQREYYQANKDRISEYHRKRYQRKKQQKENTTL